MIQHQYIDNFAPSHGLKWISYVLAGHCPSSQRWREADGAVAEARKIYGTYDKIPEYLMTPYQHADAERGGLVHEAQLGHVLPLSEYRNEIRLIETTVRLERRGFTLDASNTNRIMSDLSDKLSRNKDNALNILGEEINLLSELQVKKILYEKLKLPRQDSIDEDALNRIATTNPHPILDCIIRARAFTKGIATLRGYQMSARYDGRVHSTINTNKAGTGRQSSENPNGQNVPNEVKADVKYPIPARRCLRATPGFYLVMLDYAGVEMRLGVQGTGSKRLWKMCEEDFDFHDAFATSIYGDKYTKELNKAIKKALRGRAKNGRFAMFYGAGPETLSGTLGITYYEAVAGLERDRIEFPELYDFMGWCTGTAKKLHRIDTFFGRSLRVPYDRPYAATDYCIQGTAAALIKHAQVAVDDYIRTEIGDEIGGILLPVHDEIVMEFHRSTLPRLNTILKDIKHIMVSWPEIKVKLNIECSTSMRSWGEGHEYSIAA
jgi:DNA polymerase-1